MAVRIVVRVCFVVSLALMVAAAACGSEKSASSSSATPQPLTATPASVATLPASTTAAIPTAAAAPTTAASPSPSITQEQRQEILDIASRDPNVSRIIQGLSVTSTRVAVWADGRGTLIGAAVILTLSQPATIDGEWRGISWVDSSKTTYGVTIYTAKLSNVTAVNVWVDLAKEAVVGWTANNTAKAETTPVIIATPAKQ